MTTFIDGPAKGQTLMLKRALMFLRVVNEGKKWDALDQPGDVPELSESLHAYQLTERPLMAHLNMGRGRGGFYPLSSYKLVQVQPTDAVMRDQAKWRQWCEENKNLVSHLQGA